MGEGSSLAEFRGFVTVVTFLGIMVFIIGLIPPQMYTADAMREVEYADFEAIDIYSYAEYTAFYMNSTGGWDWFIHTDYYGHHVDIGNWNIDFYYGKGNTSWLGAFLVHITYVFWIIPADHRLAWHSPTGVKIGDNIDVSHLEQYGNGDNSVTFRAVCQHTTYHVSFSYNTTLYDNFTDAWNFGGLAFFAGVNFDDVNTAFNVWNIISMLIFFKLPNVHPIINVILSIPLWACVAYIIMIFIFKVIPLIG